MVMIGSVLGQGCPGTRRRRGGVVGLAALALASFAATGAVAQEAAEPRSLVDKATKTVETFKIDPNMTWFRDHLPDAKAVMVVPVLLKAGFIFGASGGHGALLERDETTGVWSYPAFYFMGSVTFGLQIGGEAAEVVLMIMTDRGKDALLSTEFKLGADVSVAAGPIGAGAAAATVDVLAFSREQGLFGGLTIEGAVIKPRNEWNEAYYGRPVSPADILVRHSVSNGRADPLRQAVAGARAASTGATAPPPAAASDYDLATIQRGLLAKGYDTGPADGRMGERTRVAIRQYQAAEGLPVTGEPSAELQARLTAAP